MQVAFVMPVTVALFVIFYHPAAQAAGAITPTTSCVTLAQTEAATPGGVGKALQQFSQSSSSWPGAALAIVSAVFWSLLGLQWVQNGIDYYLETAGGGTLSGFVGRYVRGMILTALTALVFVNTPAIVMGLFAAAGGVGTAVTGQTPQAWASNVYSGFQPGIFNDEGMCLSQQLQIAEANAENNVHYGGDIGQDFQNVVDSLAATFGTGIAAFFITLAFGFITILFTLTAMEMYFIAFLVILQFGGLAHDATRGWALGGMSPVFGMFAKAAALGAVSGFGLSIVDNWGAIFSQTHTIEDVMHVTGPVMDGAFMYLVLVGFLPSVVGKHFGGGALGAAVDPGGRFFATAQSGVQTATNTFFRGPSPGPSDSGGGKSSRPLVTRGS